MAIFDLHPGSNPLKIFSDLFKRFIGLLFDVSGIQQVVGNVDIETRKDSILTLGVRRKAKKCY